VPRLQSKVQRCITIKLGYTKCLFIKVRLEFLFKNVSVNYHPKVNRQTVPFCRSGEREGPFSEFCTQFISQFYLKRYWNNGLDACPLKKADIGSLHCALSLAGQCIVIGPVCVFATGGRAVCVCVFVGLLPR